MNQNNLTTCLLWGCLLHYALTPQHCVRNLVIFIQCLTTSFYYLCTMHFLSFYCTNLFTMVNSFEWFTSFKGVKSVKRATESMTIMWSIMDYPLPDMHSVYYWLDHSDGFGHCIYLRVLIYSWYYWGKKTVYLCTGCCIIIHSGSHTQFLSVCLSASSQSWDSPAVLYKKSKHFHLQCASGPFLKAFNCIKINMFQCEFVMSLLTSLFGLTVPIT